MDEKKIEKPWAVYSYGAGPSGIGRVVSDHPKVIHIQYCEGQHYQAEPWHTWAVKRFSSSKEAIEYYSKTGSLFEEDKSVETLTTHLIRDFPIAMKQEAVQSFHDILSVYQKKLSALSQPKCTQQKIDSGELDTDFGGALYETPTRDKLPHPNIKY